MEKILILDYGSQFTQLIARQVRRLGVFCEIHPHDMATTSIQQFSPDGVILSGGPQSVLAETAPRINAVVFELGKPVLGICYGMQAMMAYFGGRLVSGTGGEYGAADLRRLEGYCPLWQGIAEKTLPVWMSHGDRVVAPADGFQIVADSDEGNNIVAVSCPDRNFYGLQFHPEVAHTPNGQQLLENFLSAICGLQRDWTMPNFIDQTTVAIRQQVGGEGVLLALSGGVDSAVAAALIYRAVASQLHCVLVDNGLLRQGEVDEVRRVFEQQHGLQLIVVDASDRFFEVLASVVDPEEKRRRIGRLFIELFEQEAAALGNQVQWLAQGTIYPDVVESAKTGTGKATIKTHHNVGGLPDRLRLRLLEPLRELFKDEVRQAGLSLGLSAALVNRHPFPGPGLAVRVLGEVTRERVAVVRSADAIFIDELRRSDCYGRTAQAFAVFLPIQSVGVMGDGRTYENVIALRAVSTDDFMTADWTRLDERLLARTANRIINEVSGINRVVYDISSKPPATVEWE